MSTTLTITLTKITDRIPTEADAWMCRGEGSVAGWRGGRSKPLVQIAPRRRCGRSAPRRPRDCRLVQALPEGSVGPSRVRSHAKHGPRPVTASPLAGEGPCPRRAQRPFFGPPPPYQVSMAGRFLPVRAGGGGVDSSILSRSDRVSAGSMTSSSSKVRATFRAFPWR